MKMDALRGLHGTLGLRNVRTYLQSGNAVFEAASADADGHGEALERRILRDHGFGVAVAVKTAKAMAAVLASNPLLGKRGVDPAFLHATFLVRPVGRPSLAGVELPLSKGEEAVLVGDVVYLYCPNGYGISKLNNTLFERKLSVQVTTRNWRTVAALEAMARGEAPGP